MPPKKNVVAAKKQPSLGPGPGLERYSQDMLEFRKNMLQLYGIDASKKLGGGGFSEIFELPHNRILRIGLTAANNMTNTHRALESIRKGWELTNKSGVAPRVEFVADLPSNWVESKKSTGVPLKEGMIVTVMDRVTNIVPFPDWAKLFASDVDMAMALFRAAEKLEAVGVVHADANERNVLVRKNGEVVFVDLDDLCQIEGTTEVETFYCKRISGFTNGYCAPELQLPPAKKAALHSYIHSATGRKHNMYAGLIAVVAAAWKKIQPTDMKSASNAPKMLSTPGLKAIAEQIVGPIAQRPKSAKEIVQALSKLSSSSSSSASSKRRSSSSSNSGSVYVSAKLPETEAKPKPRKAKKRSASPCGKGKVANPHTKRCITVGGKLHKELCETAGCP